MFLNKIKSLVKAKFDPFSNLADIKSKLKLRIIVRRKNTVLPKKKMTKISNVSWYHLLILCWLHIFNRLLLLHCHATVSQLRRSWAIKEGISCIWKKNKKTTHLLFYLLNDQTLNDQQFCQEMNYVQSGKQAWRSRALISVHATDRYGVKSFAYILTFFHEKNGKRPQGSLFFHWQASCLSLIRMGIIELLQK